MLLKNSKNELETILDTAGEGIFGIGADEKCIFCNSRSIEILGYKDEKDIIGKDMYGTVYGKKKDGTTVKRENSTIYKTISTGAKVNVEDEVFWRSDDSYFEVHFFSYPMYRNDIITGAVVTFLDISERKRNEEKLQYINHHDALTGLINRQCFEMEMQSYDKEEYLPLSIIYSDLNGLKLANDVFGHEAGDRLIRTAADILISASRKKDIVARIGGDEFVWLLPNTDIEAADKIIERVKKLLSSNDANVIKCSMAMGSSAKISTEEDIKQTLKDAEYEMYQEKSAQKEKYEDETLNELIGKLHQINKYQKTHSENVSLLCEKMGLAMKWPKDRTRAIKDSGYYHDIGKIVLTKELICKSGSLTPLESMEMQQHPVVGFRLMNVFSDTLDLGDSIYYHHERWDGSGYPKGLKGEEIPINSRVIAIAEQYDHLVNPYKEEALNEEEAIKMIKEMAGTKFDPKLVEIFININTNAKGKK
ncbi:MAG TPA: diguanylate cyclase [Bacillota bacterium]|nr:diguanylate cyclase [Bacillota bacterium]